MSEPAPPAPAAASPAPAPAGGGGKGKGGGDHGHGGSKLGEAWGYAILVIVIAVVGVIGMLTSQLGGFLQMIKFNLGVFFGLAAVAFAFAAIQVYKAKYGASKK